MNLKEKILNDTKEAMKVKNELKLSVLRMLSSAIHNRELEKRSKTGKEEELSDEEVLATIRTEVKKRKDSAEQFTKGGRKDLAAKETQELGVLESFLPAEISEGELEKIIESVLSDLRIQKPAYAQASAGKDFGRVMGEVMKRVKGQASGERVTALVKKILG